MSNTVLTMDAAAKDAAVFTLPDLPSYWHAKRGVRVHLADDSAGSPFACMRGIVADTDRGPFVLVAQSLSDDERDAIVVRLIVAWARDFDARHGLTSAGAR